MSNLSQNDIDTLVERFSDRTLSKAAWTHEAHLRVALWHNWHYPYQEALAQMRTRIIAFNEAAGIANTDSSGYHETLTVFWMQLTQNFLVENKFPNLAIATEAFLKSPLACRERPLRYYTKEKLFSIQARRGWVEGDLQTLELR